MESYWKNPEGNRLNAKKLRKRNREFIDNYLLSHSCVDCGKEDIDVLEFDHVRGIKNIEVTTMIHSNSIDKIKEEIEKCEVRCANCHKKRHKTSSLAQLGQSDSVTSRRSGVQIPQELQNKYVWFEGKRFAT